MSVNQRGDNCSAGAERDGDNPANLFLSEGMKRGVTEPATKRSLTALSGTLPRTDRRIEQQVEEKLRQNSVRCSRRV